MEFTKRDKALVLITTYISNDFVKQMPKEGVVIGLKMVLLSQDVIFSESEISDAIDAIKQFQTDTMKQGFAYLQKNKDKIY